MKPVLESRCVVCHACYDAPCQLLLSSFEGAQRGATKQPVYDAMRLKAMPPTRMFVDARSTEEWRAKDFFPVLSARPRDAPSAAQRDRCCSPCSRSAARTRCAEGQRLPAEVDLDIDRTLSCPAHPASSTSTRASIRWAACPTAWRRSATRTSGSSRRWIAQGTPPPPAAALPARAQTRLEQQIAKWEAFLNGDSLQERITARYLYEHWFVAHLRLEGLPTGPFFELVRSRTAPGAPIDEIATVRPYDDPGVARVWYRLRPIQSTIVHKTHIVYPLSDAKLVRLRGLFLDASWKPTRLPGYSRRGGLEPVPRLRPDPGAQPLRSSCSTTRSTSS